MKENVPCFVVGAGVATVSLASVGWWLDSGVGVAVMLALLFTAALAMAQSWRKATAVWVGAMAATLAGLLLEGPGTLWPIALVLSGVLMAVAVFAGMAMRRLLATVTG
jgi:hypothetical protein